MNKKNRVMPKALSYAILAVVTVCIFLLLILSVGSDLGKALKGFWKGAFGSTYSIGEVLVKASPLILCGLSVAVGSHSGFTNIGAEGQFYVGATVAATIGMYWTNLPGWLLLPISMVLGFIAGGIWAMIPGILKAKLGISEVLNTIMFNYIATGIVGILLQGVLKAPDQYYPKSSPIPKDMYLPVILPKTRLHAGLIVALFCAVLVYVLIYRTYLGFRIRAVGQNPRACLVSGIDVGKSLIISSLLSGGFAGLAGACEIAGLQHRLMDGISPGYGYLAIVAALLGGNHPVGIVFASIGISMLQVGASGMQRNGGVPTSISNILLGGLVLLILGRSLIEKKLAKGGNKHVR